jgi:hypothetical protein
MPAMPSDRCTVLRCIASSHRRCRSLRMADPKTPAFRAARRCSSAIREGNTVRARGFHKPGSNLSSLRAPRSSIPSAAHQRIGETGALVL